MSENLAHFLFNMLILMLFVSALALFLFIHPSSIAAIDAVTSSINSSHQVIERSIEKVAYTQTGAQIIFGIQRGLESDIIVDGMLISKDSVPDEINFSTIFPGAVYEEDIRHDANGSIALIFFTKK